VQADPDLALVTEAWPSLSRPIRAAIIALVEANARTGPAAYNPDEHAARDAAGAGTLLPRQEN
jgi:hypothetical protein